MSQKRRKLSLVWGTFSCHKLSSVCQEKNKFFFFSSFRVNSRNSMAMLYLLLSFRVVAVARLPFVKNTEMLLLFEGGEEEIFMLQFNILFTIRPWRYWKHVSFHVLNRKHKSIAFFSCGNAFLTEFLFATLIFMLFVTVGIWKPRMKEHFRSVHNVTFSLNFSWRIEFVWMYLVCGL